MAQIGSIIHSTSGPISTVCFARPEKRNAMRSPDWDAFARALQADAAAGVRVVIVRSIDPSIFCAGSDFSAIAPLAEHPEQRAPFAVAMDTVMQLLAGGPMVSIAMVTGACHGAGVAIAAACEIRIVGPDATFSIPPARLGISYPTGDVRRIEALIGPSQTSRMLYSGLPIDAVEAARIGLADILTDDPQEEVDRMANAIAANSSQSIAAMKTLRKAHDLGQGTEIDTQFINSFGHSDFRNYLASAKDRRA